MKKQRSKTKKSIFTILWMLLLLANTKHTHALIVFQDDEFEEVPSAGILLDSDNISFGTDIYIVANQGTDNDGTIRYNATSNLWELSNDGGTFNTIATQNSIDLDTVYTNDSDKILDVDDGSGLVIDLQTTGNFDIQDNGNTFASFQNDGLFELSGAEDKEFIRLTDNDNTDSIGIYTGLNSPDGALTAQAGSVFLDQAGSGYLNISNDSGTTWSAFNLQKDNIVTVAKQGGQFTTIEAALASITDNGPSNNYIIQVYPGTYTENPLVMKAYVDVVGVNGVQSPRIEAANASANLITLASEVEIANLTINGVTTGACIYAFGIVSSFVDNIELVSCEYGVRVTLAQVSATNIRHRTGTMTNFMTVENGGFLRSLQSIITGGTLTNGYYATGAGTNMIITNSGLLNATVTNGVYVDNSATTQGAGLLLSNATNSLRVGSSGSETTLQIANVVAGATAYDLLVETDTANVAISGGIIDRNKVQIPSGNDISIFINDQTDENKGTVNLGEFATGSPENPSQGNFGEGDSYSTGMLVYTFNPTGSVYTDVSTAAQSISASTFTFPGTTTNNAIYVSSDRTDELGNFVLFQGYKSFTSSTALSEGAGSVVHEYWNGSSWTAFNVMCTHETLYYRYGNDCFLRANNREQIRFDRNIIDDWTANDPPTTGTNRYWIRIRIASNITTAPVFEQFKIHSSRTEIGTDGTVNFFANARQRRTFITSPSQILFGLGSSSPNNNSFTVGTGGINWSDQRIDASFNGTGTSDREITGSIALPKGIDTSNGLRARIYWKKNNNAFGDVQWHIDYLMRGAKSVLVADGSNIDPAPRTSGESITGTSGSSIETTPIGNTLSNTEIILSEFTEEIIISDYYEGDMLFLRLHRDASDPDDTYNNNAILIGFELNGVFWTLGEKL